jgi:hypothetical protein
LELTNLFLRDPYGLIRLPLPASNPARGRSDSHFLSGILSRYWTYARAWLIKALEEKSD